VSTAWLTHGRDVAAGARIAAEHGHPWLNTDFASALAAGTEGIHAAHAAGVLVGVWTVDAPDDARTLASAGVDIIISNVPDVVMTAVTS
jgi:glycerophosphoryl diester phosphodiesterase